MPSWRYLLKYLRDAAYAGRYGPPYITLSLPVIGITAMTSSKLVAPKYRRVLVLHKAMRRQCDGSRSLMKGAGEMGNAKGLEI